MSPDPRLWCRWTISCLARLGLSASPNLLSASRLSPTGTKSTSMTPSRNATTIHRVVPCRVRRARPPAEPRAPRRAARLARAVGAVVAALPAAAVDGVDRHDEVLVLVRPAAASTEDALALDGEVKVILWTDSQAAIVAINNIENTGIL